MKKLRDPNGGCPWDLEQDFKSILPYTLEEAYEVADAIDNDDMVNLREELGDLLFQPVYHAQMAAEEGLFTIQDVIHDITAKMIERHPHVFGDTQASTPEDVDKIWDNRKKEKKINSNSAVDGVPNALPALLRSQKLQKKAAKVGFTWPNTKGILEKLHEEIAEFDSAIKNNDIENMEEEFGDILFVLTNFARMHNINAEESLRKTNNKFINRFKGMEENLKRKNQKMEAFSLEELLTLWSAQKSK